MVPADFDSMPCKLPRAASSLAAALSRAKRLLIIVGDSQLFRTKDIYDNVYKTVYNHENGKILTAEEYGL